MSSSFDSTSRKLQRSALRRATRNVKLGLNSSSSHRHLTDRLEPRQLLATISGGEYLEFQYFDATRIRIQLNGTDAASLDIIGSTLDERGNARLNDVPASVYSNGQLVRRILGGYAGEIGVQQVAGVDERSPIDVTDPFGQTPGFTAPSGDVSITALAAKSSGALFGLNLESIRRGANDFRFVQLLSIDNATGNATVVDYLQDKILAAVLPKADLSPQRPDDIKRIVAADWDPQNPGDLYFVAEVNQPRFDPNAQNGLTDTDVPLLFRYRAGQVEVMGDFNSTSAALVSDISAMTFLDDGRLLVYGSAKNIEGIGDDTTIVTYKGLFFSNRTADINPTGNIDIVFKGSVLGSLVSMEYVPNEDSLMIVDTGGSSSQLLRINNVSAGFGGNAIALSYGPLALPNSGSRQIGAALTDLTWNPRVINPFTGERGALMAADQNADQLVFIDYRERFPETGLFNMTLRNSGPDTQVIVTQYNDDGEPTPYEGDAGSIRNIYNTGSASTPLRDGTGVLYLGIRERLNATSGLVVPVLSLDRSTFAGSAPANTPETVTAGLFLTDGGADRIFFDGTITGQININGAVGLLYAGNILTGDASGGSELSDRNFYVSGDLRNVVVRGDVGTMPTARPAYNSGVDIDVNGKIGQFRVQGDFKAALRSTGLLADTSLENVVEEIETKPVEGVTVGDIYVAGFLSDTDLYNDTIDTPQMVGTYYSSRRRRGGQAQMVGDMNSVAGDTQDYWGLPLVAGQVFDVQIEPTGFLPVHMEIYDPEGRRYASDDLEFDAGGTRNLPVQIRADKPGIWKIRAVAEFAGTTSYAITINRAADLSLGALVVDEDMSFNNTERALDITSGDAGALVAGGIIEHSALNDLIVRRGNLRSINASATGLLTPAGTYTNIPNLFVPGGNVGRVETTGNLRLNARQLDTNGEPITSYGVGVDYQLVTAGGDVSAVLIAKRGIGVIRGNTLGSERFFPGYYRNDSDNSGDGFIELIESGSVSGATRSGGTIGSPIWGGPAIENGPRGNVKYLIAHGTVYRDSLFGGGTVSLLESQGDTLELRDDSGALVRMRPLGTPLLSATNPGTGTGTGTGTGGSSPFDRDPFGGFTGDRDPFGGFTNNPGATSNGVTENAEGRIIAAAYPVRGSATGPGGGGSIIYEVQSTRGIRIETVADGKDSRAEIGRLSTTGSGSPIIFTPSTGSTTGNPFGGNGGSADFDPTGRDLSVIITGDAPTSVFELVGRDELAGSGNTNVGAYTLITNSTTGEMVNMNIESVGYLEVESLGEARSQSGTKIEGNSVFDDSAIDPQVIITESLTRTNGVATFTRIVGTTSATGVGSRDFFAGANPVGNGYPFSNQKNGVLIGDVIRLRSRRSLGNVVITGQAVRVEANSDKKGVKGVVEGITGPLVVNTQVNFIDIGEGVLPSGSGDVGFAGIYVLGSAGKIYNQGVGTDIRGDVIVGSYLDEISLDNGSIIDAQVLRSLSFAAGIDTDEIGYIDTGSTEAPDDNAGNPGSLDFPIIGKIRAINISGNGGVIGSQFSAREMGLISINGGFGFINSAISGDSAATIAGVATDGLGIRGSTFVGGRSLGEVSARGTTGRLLKLSKFSNDVRFGQTETFDPYSGRVVSAASDLYAALGVAPGTDRQSGVTNEGIIENVTVAGARTLGKLLAYQVRAVGAQVTPATTTYPMRLNVGDSIGEIRIAESIQGLGLVTGRLDSLRINGEARNFALRTSGRVKELVFGGNVRGTSSIAVSGGSGILDKLIVGGNLFASVEASVRIGSIFVGRNLGSSNIRSFGSFGTLEVARDISSTARVRANGKMDSLIVGGNVADGAVVRATSFGKQEVDGTIFGDIIVG